MPAKFSELVEIRSSTVISQKTMDCLLEHLYLRSIGAARERSFFWTGLISITCSASLAWLEEHGFAWLHG